MDFVGKVNNVKKDWRALQRLMKNRGVKPISNLLEYRTTHDQAYDIASKFMTDGIKTTICQTMYEEYRCFGFDFPEVCFNKDGTIIGDPEHIWHI